MLKNSSNKIMLFKNTIFLYILTFSSYFFSFITVPYQTRILGPEYFGKIGFATAFMTYFSLVMDFGFLLAATERVAKNRDNTEELSKIVTAVNIIKIVLMAISFALILVLCTLVPKLKQELLLYIITFLSVAFGALLPDYLYRGLEDMKSITIRAVLIKFFFVIMIFLFLRESEDYYLVPLFTLIGNLGALILVYIHATKKFGIRFVHVEPRYIWDMLKNASVFFYSRIASTVYTATNTFVLGLIYPIGSSAVGLFSSADKLISTAKSGFSPIADSLYPYMIKNRDFKLVRKVLFIIMPPVILICVFVGVFAENISAFLLGEDFRSAGKILIILLPIVVLTPLTYILGFPVLSPMGLNKHANLSIIYASIIHILGLVFLFLIGEINVFSLSYLTVISEIFIVSYRIVVVWKNRKLFPEVQSESELKKM